MQNKRTRPLHRSRVFSIFKGLVFLAVIDLGAPTCEDVFCSDASEAGYGLHVARVPEDDVRLLARYRERWRFDPEGKRPAPGPATFTPGWTPGAGGSLGGPQQAAAVWDPIPRNGALGPRLDDTHDIVYIVLHALRQLLTVSAGPLPRAVPLGAGRGRSLG